jgi:hypothetical protein
VATDVGIDLTNMETNITEVDTASKNLAKTLEEEIYPKASWLLDNVGAITDLWLL